MVVERLRYLLHRYAARRPGIVDPHTLRHERRQQIHHQRTAAARHERPRPRHLGQHRTPRPRGPGAVRPAGCLSQDVVSLVRDARRSLLSRIESYCRRYPQRQTRRRGRTGRNPDVGGLHRTERDRRIPAAGQSRKIPLHPAALRRRQARPSSLRLGRGAQDRRRLRTALGRALPRRHHSAREAAQSDGNLTERHRRVSVRPRGHGRTGRGRCELQHHAQRNSLPRSCTGAQALRILRPDMVRRREQPRHPAARPQRPQGEGARLAHLGHPAAAARPRLHARNMDDGSRAPRTSGQRRICHAQHPLAHGA